jgi:hypothetical protein
MVLAVEKALVVFLRWLWRWLWWWRWLCDGDCSGDSSGDWMEILILIT